MVFRLGSTARPSRRPRRVKRPPRYMREYAERMAEMGLDEFRRYAGPVLVGAGMLGTLEDEPNRQRRTHNMADDEKHIQVQALLDRVWPLRPGDQSIDERFVAVGHHHDADVVISDYSLSSLHAAFTKTRPVTVTDLRSLNGTFVNGVQIEARKFVPLDSGDEVRLGRLVLRYYDGPGFLAALEELR